MVLEIFRTRAHFLKSDEHQYCFPGIFKQPNLSCLFVPSPPSQVYFKLFPKNPNKLSAFPQPLYSPIETIYKLPKDLTNSKLSQSIQHKTSPKDFSPEIGIIFILLKLPSRPEGQREGWKRLNPLSRCERNEWMGICGKRQNGGGCN